MYKEFRRIYRESQGTPKTTAMVAELKNLFGDMKGPVRLHWESNEGEAEQFRNLDECLSEVAAQAIERGQTARQVEKLAYILTEAEWQEQENEHRSLRESTDNSSELSIRQKVLKEIEDGDWVNEALIKAHQRNYETLYVDHDGDLWWSEEADSYTHRRNTARLCQVGTGSVPCNCDWCSGPDAVESPYDIEFDSDAYAYMTDELVRALDEIDEGYFDDEEED